MERRGKELRVFDQLESESKPKNIYESLRETQNTTAPVAEKVVQSRSIKEIKFYANENDVGSQRANIERSDATEGLSQDTRKGHQISLEDIRIDLPTYRPPAKSAKDFPYEFVKGETDQVTDTTTTTGGSDEEMTTVEAVRNSEDRKDRKVEQSWLKFDIPVFRAISRSLQDWTAGFIGGVKRKRSELQAAAVGEKVDATQGEEADQKRVPVRKFIPFIGTAGSR